MVQQWTTTNEKKIRNPSASGQTCANCHSHLNNRNRNSWTNIGSKITGCNRIRGWSNGKCHCWKCYSRSRNIQHHFSDINGSVVLNVYSCIVVMSQHQFECICYWIWAVKCKVDVWIYVSMLLIAEINANPAWIPRKIIVSIGLVIICMWAWAWARQTS